MEQLKEKLKQRTTELLKMYKNIKNNDMGD